MASQVWPASLPQSPLIQGFEEQPPKTSITTQMDQGPAKKRRRATTNVRPIVAQFIMDKSQVDTFDTFYNDTTAGGSLRFDFKNPRTGVTKEFRFRDTMPTITPLSGDLFRVNVELEIMP